jgi:YgiT-type zinc finger domain-containing protein
MRTKARPTKERCAVCGGTLRLTTITHEERRRSRLYLFQHVPAQVCTVCGEVWIDEATLREVDRLLRKGEPVRKLETPVYDFAVQ